MSFLFYRSRQISAHRHGASRAVVVSRGALVSQRVGAGFSHVAASETSVSFFKRIHLRARSARQRCASHRSLQRLSVVGVLIVKSSSSIGTASVSSARMQVHRLRSTVSPNKALKTDALKTARVLA